MYISESQWRPVQTYFPFLAFFPFKNPFLSLWHLFTSTSLFLFPSCVSKNSFHRSFCKLYYCFCACTQSVMLGNTAANSSTLHDLEFNPKSSVLCVCAEHIFCCVISLCVCVSLWSFNGIKANPVNLGTFSELDLTLFIAQEMMQ